MTARMLVAAVQAVAVLIVAMLLGADFAGNPLLLVLLTVMAGVTFMPLGFAVGARASGVESASVMSGMVVLPVIFLSAAFFPTSGLPGWLEAIVEFMPMAPLIDAMRIVAIDGGGLADTGGNLLTVIAWTPAVFAIAVFAIRSRAVKAAAPRRPTSELVEANA